MALKFADPLPPALTVNVALIGPPKTGKTTGADSIPGKVLHLNCDLPTAARFSRLLHGDRIHEVELEGMDTLIDVTHAVYDEKEGWDSLVVDPVGELHRVLLEEESNRAVRPTLNQYGDISTAVERFLRAMCSAPVNAVFVCHDLPIQDETGEGIVLPFMGTTGKGGLSLGRKLLGMVDVIGFTGVIDGEDGREYVAQLTPNKGRPGGDRFNVLAGDTGYRRLDLGEWLEAIHASEPQQDAELKENAPEEENTDENNNTNIEEVATA